MSGLLKRMINRALESDQSDQAPKDAFDKASAANAASQSDTPEAKAAAVDFDSEIAKLRGEKQEPPADDQASQEQNTPPAEGGEEGAPTEAPSEPAPEDGEKPAEENKPEEDEDVPPAEEGEVAQPVTEPDPDAKTEAATEALVRVCRCLEHLEHVSQFSVFNPVMQAAVENEIQAATHSIGLVIARPATEGIFDPDTNLGKAKDYAVTTIKKILELLRKLWDSSKKYISDFIRSYMASRGVYKRDLVGLNARFAKISFDPEKATTVPFKLKALANNAPILTTDTLLRSANVARSLAANTATVCASADDVMSKSLAAMGDTQDPAAFEFPSIARNFKVFNGTTSVASAGELTIEDHSLQRNANGDYAFSISGIPGGHAIEWTFEALHQITGWDKVTQTMMKYDFTQSTLEMDNTSIEMSNSKDNIKMVLAMAGDTAVSAHISKCMDAITAKRQLVERVITLALNQFATGPNQQTQEAARALSIAANAYERVYVRPVYFAAKLAAAVDGELLDIAKTLIGTYDNKPKEQD